MSFKLNVSLLDVASILAMNLGAETFAGSKNREIFDKNFRE